MEFKLIFKKINNTLTPEEETIFNDWFAESDIHRAYFAQVQENYLKSPRGIDIEEGWNNIFSEIGKNRRIYYWKYAAAIAVVLSLGSLFLSKNKEDAEPNMPIVVEAKTILIGTDKATLTLEDGSEVVLGKGESYAAKNLSSNGEKIVYNSAANTNNQKIAFNILTIPRGGQFFIELSDGTKVWLNSESKLRYPVTFTKGLPRKVELIYGEGYFEVSPSDRHDGSNFKVTTQNQSIEVLGTEFNIKAYKGDAVIATTLIVGEVEVRNAEVKKELLPGNQSRFNIETGNINIVPVDVYNEISWKDGLFSFKNKPLKEIMEVLSRWYDVRIEIENIKGGEIKFNGVFNKKQDIKNILTIIESTNEAKFIVKNKTIIMK